MQEGVGKSGERCRRGGGRAGDQQGEDGEVTIGGVNDGKRRGRVRYPVKCQW